MSDAEAQAMDVHALAERLDMRPAEIYREVREGRLACTEKDSATQFTEAQLQAFIEQRDRAATELEQDIDQWLHQLLPQTAPDLPETGDDAQLEPEPEAVAPVPETLEQKRGRLPDAMLHHALDHDVRDLYVDPLDEGARILFRRGGAVRTVKTLSPRLFQALLPEIKARFGVSGEVSHPQSGAFVLEHNGNRVQIRGTVAPTPLGEHVHFMLFGVGAPASLAEIGYSAEQTEALQVVLDGRPGLFLVVGPMGPLAEQHRLALASMLAAGDRLVVSMEHRVHVKSPDLVQLQITADNENSGFPAMFQTAMAMSPSVLFLDDIGGAQEAAAAVEAVAAGMTVVARVRASDGPAAVLALLEHGVARTVMARDLIGLVADRVVRRVCPQCRTWRTPTADEIDALALPADAKVAQKHTCEACGDGMAGRRVLHDLWIKTAELRTLLQAVEPPADSLYAWAAGRDFSLHHAARMAVIDGDVLPEDVISLL